MNAKRSILLATAVLCLAAAAWAADEGKALFESKCTVCHEASRALTASKNRAGWDKTIAQMKAKGAKVSAEEAAAIAEYLIRKTAPKS